MSYIAVTLNHHRALQACARAYDASVHLDMLTMQLDVRARNRYYTLYPRFLSRSPMGHLAHADALSDDTVGFIGWLPYAQITWPLATDKLAFRQHLLEVGERVPAAWSDPAQADSGYLLKRSMGSFGRAQSGPFRAGVGGAPPAGKQGVVFAEQFIEGDNIKVWFWGDHAFFAHLHPRPAVTGDGATSLADLIDRQLAHVGTCLTQSPDRDVILGCLEYQGTRADHPLTAGQQVWFDYRYGRLHSPDPATYRSDNRLDTLPQSVRAQIDALGVALAPALRAHLSAPVLYAADGVVDAAGQIWWLEMNCNPILPPEGYVPIFATLFGAP